MRRTTAPRKKATPTATAAAAKPDISKAGDVTLTVWDQEVRGGQKKQIEQLNKEFQAKYPNVKIERVAKSFEDLIKTVKLAASGPKAPDVVEANQGRPIMGEMVKAGLLRPVTDYAKIYGWDDRYSPLLLDLNKFSSDGKEFGSGDLYGLSQMGEIVGVYYNKTMVPTPPTTLDEFEASLQEFKDAGRDPDPVRQPREVARHPQLRERARADRRQAGDPRLRVRQGRGVVRQPAVHRRAPRRSRSGSTRATSTRTSTAPTTTRRGRRSPRARAPT